jgi:hypothetical protein
VNSPGTGSAQTNSGSLESMNAFEVSFETSKFDLTLFVTDMGNSLLFS